jgi:acyl-CoA dehydrogenase
MRGVATALEQIEGTAFATIARQLAGGIEALEQASEWLRRSLASDPEAALAGSVNYLMLTGYVCGGWQLARAALRANAALNEHKADRFFQAKIITASFYAEQILPRTAALLAMVRAGASYAGQLPVEQF